MGKDYLLKNILEIKLLLKNNPHHDALGRFASSNEIHEDSSGLFGKVFSNSTSASNNSRLEKNLEKKYSGTKFDFQGMHPEVARKSAEKISELLDTYPSVQKSLKYFGNGLNAKKYERKLPRAEAIGHCITDKLFNESESYICMNSNYTDTPDKIEKVKKSSYDNCWTAALGLDSVISHEFGHVVNFHLLKEGSEKSFLPVYSEDGIGQVGSTVKEWMQQHDYDGQTVSGYAQEGGTLEQFAEGFSVLHSKGGDTNNAYVKSLKTLLDKSYGENGAMTIKKKKKADSLNAEQISQARELYSQLKKSKDDDFSKNGTWIEKLSQISPKSWRKEKFRAKKASL